MELPERVANLVRRAASSNVVLNSALIGVFAVLTARSYIQQKDIAVLEAQKQSLVISNKAMKKTIWDWKQQLFSEAEASSDKSLIPLSRLKAIYGEAPAAIQSSDGVEDSPASKVLI
ncbi:uncharacterized protein LOC124927438 [Impatiens glandulifera]|uniref:uncharacterized protein LOC124927438 n=1 Tax=Impatiens glandulifera TaxID=253017 RepID=UPI001FB11A87|nr:uncharacterized protein LOC124927438 [Impatiens glandulifera]